ncbi:MAG: LysM peptidoglycan-binding domain-containing protein [Candidatus Thiodiazotropha sp.]
MSKSHHSSATFFSKPYLLTMNLIAACLLAACQSLPNGAAESSQSEVPLDSLSRQTVQHQPETASKQINAERMPEVAEQLSAVVASLPDPTPRHVWDRMRQSFTLTIPSNKRSTKEFNWYKKHPKYVQRIQQRAAPFLYFILEEIDKRNIPAEIALLPAVESAFQPFAYSPGRAAGIWQFIPSTGRHFGLKQNWWYDGRRDVVSSTRAALNYLQRLNKQFGGDWELALAAYNSGAGTVGSAIKRNRKRGKPTDYWSLKLPDETSVYVPRLLALTKIFKDAESYGIDLDPVADKAYFATVDIKSQLDLALAAEMAEIPIQELYLLNAGFNRWATAPDGPHQLTLPIDRIEPFKQKLANLPQKKRLTWKRYKIKSGDSLSVIASRHGTTTKLIRQVNKLSGNRIRAGKHLLIPVSSKKIDHYVYTQEQRKAAIQNRNRKGVKKHYRVQSGDSLWTIARTFNVSYKKLAAWNGMAPGDPLKIGQRLVIWATNNSSNVSLLDLQPRNTQSRLHYKVKRGDSLSRIAQRFKVSVSDLKRWNTIKGKYLQPGQQIKLYVDVTEQTL